MQCSALAWLHLKLYYTCFYAYELGVDFESPFLKASTCDLIWCNLTLEDQLELQAFKIWDAVAFI